MTVFKSFLKNLRATDTLVISFGIFLSILNVIFHSKIDGWLTHVLLNFLVLGIILIIAYYDKHKTNMFWQQIHYWYLVPIIFISFKEIYFMVKPIRGVDYDQLLIEIDRWIFGTDPTIVLQTISFPLLTEILQIVYGTFFFLPVILGINLLLTNREDDFHFMAFTVVLGFFLSYIGYFLLPAIGPRFTLHDFDSTNIELPGLFLTNYLREIVNAGESIPFGTPNPAEVVQRDVFPSGHTQMTLIVMYLSYKFNVKSKYFLIPNGTLLIFSTVYLRYHYVIDLIAGFVFMIATVLAAKFLYNKWMRFKGENEFSDSKY